MSDISTLLANLRRPRLLIRAARHGLCDYRRDRDLRRLIDAPTPPSPESALAKLFDAEETDRGNPPRGRCGLFAFPPHRSFDRNAGRGALAAQP